MRITLVTGATGFIGSHLCEHLMNSGFNVRAGVRSRETKLNSIAQSHPGIIENVELDLSQEESLTNACKGVDVIFHAAGVAHAGTSNIEQLHQVNVQGTVNLIKACKAARIPRLVFFSSILAQTDDIENSSNDAGAYGSSKRKAEEILLNNVSESFEVSILRPVNVYGPGMKGNISGMIERIRSGSLPPLPKLYHSLSLVGVSDLCQAALLAADSDLASGKIYTVTDGISYEPNAIEASIYSVLERKKPSWHTPRMVFYAASLGAQIANNLGVWKNDLGLRTYRNLVGHESSQGSLQEVSCEKITTELGYEPSQSFYDVLPAIIEAIE